MKLTGSDLRRFLQRRIKECSELLERLRLEATPARADVESLALRLGRKLRPKYGSEPTYQSKWFPKLTALSIPNKSPLKKGTKGKILNVLDGDLAELRRWLERVGGPI